MTDAISTAASLLAVDVGTANTRAFLFDSVEGSYRLIAVGCSPTTLAAPFRDASEGIQSAINQVEEITGRVLMHIDTGIIIPTNNEGHGVDGFVATLSAGEPIRVLAVGLLDDISLDSARRLLNTTYSKIVDTIGMNDRRKIEERIDVVLRARPDLIVIAGGTEGGASKSVHKLVESIGLACYLLPESQRPQILYAGNSLIASEVQNDLAGIVSVDIAPNIRPELESEQLSPAQNRLREMYRIIRTKDNAPLMELSNWSGGKLMPTTQAFSRIVRFFSRFYPPGKGVLGVDLGAGSTTIAASFYGKLTHHVHSNLGMGEVLPNLLEYTDLDNITRWLKGKASSADVHAYILHKAAHPSSLPVTPDELEIEQALAREILRTAIRASKSYFPENAPGPGHGELPWFEPIVVSGSVVANAPSRAQSLLMVLDGLEPVGITTVVLDPFNLIPALGATSELNPLLTVQIIDSRALVNLATVIAPNSSAQPGTPILRLRVTYESGEEKKMEIKQGSLEKIPVYPGEEVKLSLQPLNRVDIGMGRPGLGGGLTLKKAGDLGIIIDARGRPLQIPMDAGRRRGLLEKWFSVLEN